MSVELIIIYLYYGLFIELLVQRQSTKNLILMKSISLLRINSNKTHESIVRWLCVICLTVKTKDEKLLRREKRIFFWWELILTKDCVITGSIRQ